MPNLSQTKKDKISEQILHYLFTTAPQAKFTASISREIARDEEFVKALLIDLEKKSLVIQIKKNNQGETYARRQRWLLTNEAFLAYQKHQIKANQQNISESTLHLETNE